MVRKGAYTEIGGECYSYDTCLFTRFSSGMTVGNVTKYSRTTSRHQRLAKVFEADLQIDDAPVGIDAMQLREKGLSARFELAWRRAWEERADAG